MKYIKHINESIDGKYTNQYNLLYAEIEKFNKRVIDTLKMTITEEGITFFKKSELLDAVNDSSQDDITIEALDSDGDEAMFLVFEIYKDDDEIYLRGYNVEFGDSFYEDEVVTVNIDNYPKEACQLLDKLREM